MAAPSYRFLPWVRSGLAASLDNPDDVDGDVPGRAVIEVGVEVTRSTGTSLPVTKTLRVLGPGDVVGLDPQQVIRTDPPSGTTDAEPNYLVQVELDRPDLPWLFTPAAANGQQQLRPWLALVVVDEGAGVNVLPTGAGGLPVLDLTADAAPARQLPDLATSWAWAHAQVLLTGDEDVDDVLGRVFPRDAGRLVCSRRLDPTTAYLACIVPAFEAGRRAGLGLPPEDADENLRPAWSVGVAAIQLPIYYQWRFRTGGGGDFEQLARALRPRPLPATAGLQTVFVGSAGSPLPAVAAPDPGGLVQLAGALVAPGVVAPEWPAATRSAVVDGLAEALDTAAEQVDGPDDPVVDAPLYGQWLAASKTVPAAGPELAWLRDLNVDPRHRAVAGLGAVAVAGDQETLMDQAWAQVGAVEQANRELRWAQLAREVRASLLRRHVEPLEDGAVLGVTSVVHRRLRVLDSTVAAQVRASAMPDAVVTPSFRRATAPRGALARRLRPAEPRVPRPLVSGLDQGTLTVGAPTGPPDGLFRFQAAVPENFADPSVVAEIDAARAAALGRRPRVLTDTQLRTVPVTTQVVSRLRGVIGTTVSDAFVREFQLAEATRLKRESSVLDAQDDPARPGLGVATLARAVVARLEPEKTVLARMLKRLRATDPVHGWPAGQRGTDPLRDIMAAPVFTRPAWEYVRDHAPGLVLPGVEELPLDSVTLAETNPEFAEAMLVGLNHEMARELLWREYPTDQRGSCFRRFWAPGGADDVPDLHTWETGGLGVHQVGGVSRRLVLLLRGRLLFRYPHTVVYAAPDNAGRPDLAEQRVLLPLFRGRVEPDVAFCGFALDRDRALAEGWWFLLEEQPTAPRFGLDIADGFGADAPALSQWNDLTWGHFAEDAATLAAMTRLDPGTPPADPPSGPVWGADAASMAAILVQQPVRVAIRARDLLPAPGGPDGPT